MNYPGKKIEDQNGSFQQMGRRETWPWRNKRQRTCVKSRKGCPDPPSLGIEIQTPDLVSTSPSMEHAGPSEESSDSQRALNSSDTDMEEDFQVTSMGELVGSGADHENGSGGEVPSKGVRKRGTKWVAEIRNRHLKGGRSPGRKWLGTFSTAAEAREAYAVAAKKIKSCARPKASKSFKSLPERSNRARKHVRMHFDNDMVGYGSCTTNTEDLAFDQDPLNSVDFAAIKNGSSSEPEGTKRAAVIQSASECSSDFARTNLPTPKFPTDVRKSEHLKHVRAPCLTSSADSLQYSNYQDQASDSAAATASPTASKCLMSSSSATSRRVKNNAAVKNEERASSREAFWRRKKAVPTACHDHDHAHGHGPFEGAPEMSQTPRKAGDNVHVEPTRLTMKDVRSRGYYSGGAVADHDETVNYSHLQPAFEEKDDHTGPSSSADEVQASSPTCTCTLMCTAEDHSCAPGPHCSCSCQPAEQNLNENFEWLEDLGQNEVAVDPVQTSVQTELTLQLVQSRSWDTIVKSEDLAAFKTRHVLCELNAQSDDESQQCIDREAKVPSNSSRQRLLSKERDCRNGCSGSPIFPPGPASSSVCKNTIPVSGNQVPLIDSEPELVMNRAEQSVRADLVESGSLTVDTSYVSNDDGASETTFFEESDGLEFLPLDDLLEYF